MTPRFGSVSEKVENMVRESRDQRIAGRKGRESGAWVRGCVGARKIRIAAQRMMLLACVSVCVGGGSWAGRTTNYHALAHNNEVSWFACSLLASRPIACNGDSRPSTLFSERVC